MHNISSPDRSDAGIERQLAAATSAPRITLADIEASIGSETYFSALDGRDGSDIAQMRAHDPAKTVAIRPLYQDPPAASTTAAPLALITICVLILKNGYRIVGVNEGPVSADTFDASMGRSLARQKAVDQLWPLMGYALKESLVPKNTDATNASDYGNPAAGWASTVESASPT